MQLTAYLTEILLSRDVDLVRSFARLSPGTGRFKAGAPHDLGLGEEGAVGEHRVHEGVREQALRSSHTRSQPPMHASGRGRVYYNSTGRIQHSTLHTRSIDRRIVVRVRAIAGYTRGKGSPAADRRARGRSHLRRTTRHDTRQGVVGGVLATGSPPRPGPMGGVARGGAVGSHCPPPSSRE